MTSFERFLAGEDRLAALLRELPAYTPAPGFDAAFATAAARAQAAQSPSPPTPLPQGERGALSGTATHKEASPPTPLPQGERGALSGFAMPAFEPPASLEASFLKMAANIDAAQAPRREALLAQIAKGDSPQAAMEADLQPATTEWLQAKATPKTPEKSSRRPVFLGFSWFDLRLAGLACVLAAVGTQLALKHAPSPESMAMRNVFQAALRPEPQAEQATAELAKDAQQSLAEAQRALDQAEAARQSTPATDKKNQLARATPQAPAAAPAPAIRAEAAPAAEKVITSRAGIEVSAQKQPEEAPPASLSGQALAKALASNELQEASPKKPAPSPASATPLLADEAVHRERAAAPAAPIPMPAAAPSPRPPPQARAAAAAPLKARDEIDALLNRLKSSGCSFNRNGTWYSAAEAHAHLLRKLGSLENRPGLHSAEQFIELGASASSLSGKAYLVKCGDQAPIPSQEWFSKELSALRAAAQAPTQ